MSIAHGRRAALAAVGGVTAALAISACGSFDSAASGAKLIKQFVAHNGQGDVSVKSVKCPAGIKEVTGRSFNCNVTLHYQRQNRDASGQITIHMVQGDQVEIQGSRDLHF